MAEWPSADSLFQKLQGESKSLLKKHLTKAIYDQVKDQKTKTNDGTEGGIQHCIRSGCEHLDSGVGLYACDPEAYEKFRPLFDAVIKDYHNVKTDEIKHPTPNWGTDEEVKSLGDLDPSGEMIVSTRVRVGRSYAGYGFPPIISDKKREEIEKNAMDAFEQFSTDSDLSAGPGKNGYLKLTEMTPEEQQQCIKDHFLFNDSDRMLKSAGGYRNWPHNRGIYFNANKTFLVWVNEEDHLRLISMQKGGNVGEVYARLVKAANKFAQIAQFATNPRLGNLTFCPTNLGTGLRASVHIKIPKLQKDQDTLNKICKEYDLQPRGQDGEHTESPDGIFDISNKERLGLTEWDAISKMKKGVLAIMKQEKEMK